MSSISESNTDDVIHIDLESQVLDAKSSHNENSGSMEDFSNNNNSAKLTGIKRKKKTDSVNPNSTSNNLSGISATISEVHDANTVENNANKIQKTNESLPNHSTSSHTTVSIPQSSNTSNQFYSEVLDKSLCSALKQQVLHLAFGDNATHLSHNKTKTIPGTMPFTVTREHFSKLINELYWVAEKSDGVRKLFFVSKEQKAVYLIDRAWKFDILNHSIQYWKMFEKEQSDILLDGELTLDETTQTERFAVFDVLYFNKIEYTKHYLIERHKAVTKIISLYQANKSSFPPAHLSINSKAFREMKFINNILDCIKPVYDDEKQFTGHYLYKDDKGRCNHNDGIIFTPVNENYFCDTHKIYKWKWPTMNTVDFLIIEPFINISTGKLALYVQGDKGNKEELYESTRPNSSTMQWINKIRALKKRDCVVECARTMDGSDPSKSWQIVGWRLDKLLGNYIGVAEDTETAINDNITEKEIRELANKVNPALKPVLQAPK